MAELKDLTDDELKILAYDTAQGIGELQRIGQQVGIELKARQQAASPSVEAPKERLASILNLGKKNKNDAAPIS